MCVAKLSMAFQTGACKCRVEGNSRFHRPGACTAANVRVVAVLAVRVRLQPDNCFKLPEALLPSPRLNHPAPSFVFPLLGWCLHSCSLLASQSQINRLFQVESDQYILSDQFSVPGDC